MDLLKEIILKTKLWLVLAAIFFTLIIGLGIGGNLLAARLPLEPSASRKAGNAAIVVMFVLGCGLMFCVVPVMLRAVLHVQERAGNQGVPLVAFALRHESHIVLIFWAIYALGMVMAGPPFFREMLRRR